MPSVVKNRANFQVISLFDGQVRQPFLVKFWVTYGSVFTALCIYIT